MYPRVKYKMSDDDLETILKACEPVPYIIVGSSAPSSPQENANRAWQALGEKMGFDYTTVQPIPETGMAEFTAVPSETEERRKIREAKIEEENRQTRITYLKSKITRCEEQLAKLEST